MEKPAELFLPHTMCILSKNNCTRILHLLVWGLIFGEQYIILAQYIFMTPYILLLEKNGASFGKFHWVWGFPFRYFLILKP